MHKQSFPIYLLVIILIIISLQIPGLVFNLYSEFWWLDVLMHFLGGFWIGGVALWYFFSSGRTSIFKNNKNYLLVSVITILVVGLSWEVFEIGVDFATGLYTYQYLDGFYDMVMGTLGATGVAYLYILKLNSKYEQQKT